MLGVDVYSLCVFSLVRRGDIDCTSSDLDNLILSELGTSSRDMYRISPNQVGSLS